MGYFNISLEKLDSFNESELTYLCYRTALKKILKQLFIHVDNCFLYDVVVFADSAFIREGSFLEGVVRVFVKDPF